MRNPRNPHLVSVEALRPDTIFQARTTGTILTAPCALSTLINHPSIRVAGIGIFHVTGRITNAPLFVNELALRSSVSAPIGGGQSPTPRFRRS